MFETVTRYLLDNTAVLIAGAVFTLLLLVLMARTIQAFARAKKRAEKLTGPVMFLGFVWSAEAVWELTGEKGASLPIGLRIAMFTVLEFMLLVAMLRTADSMKDNGHPGRSGRLAWAIAVVMAVVGFMAGVLIDDNMGVAVFRPIVPLTLTALWWIGIVGEGSPGETSSWNWTPRNILIRLGALKPGQQDVKTVQRDHLLQRMTDLYHRIQHASGDRKKKLEARLAKMTLDADDAMVREVMARVSRTTWVTTQPLPYSMTQPDAAREAANDAPDDAVGTALVKQMKLTPARRSRPASPATTSGDAPDADPATQAALLAMTQNIPVREAARKVPGATPATTRRRFQALAGDASVTQNQTNGHPVLSGTGTDRKEN